MGRKRQSRNDLPSRMYFKCGSYYFVDKGNRWVKIGKDFKEAMLKYSQIIDGIMPIKNVASFIDQYLREEAPKTKTARTVQNNYEEAKKIKAVFGALNNITSIDSTHLYRYKSGRPPVSANRELALLSCIFNYAISLGMAKENPCRQVRRNRERPRDREVTQAEYDAVYLNAPGIIQVAMDMALITGLRIGDLLSLKIDQIKDEGIFVKTRKTGKKNLIEWNDDLKAVVNRARTLRGKVSSMYLICTRDGQRYTGDGFAAIWQRTMKKAVDTKAITERFTFHDLRSYAADESDNPSELLGHDDPRQTNRIYRRRTRKVTPNSFRIKDKA